MHFANMNLKIKFIITEYICVVFLCAFSLLSLSLSLASLIMRRVVCQASLFLSLFLFSFQNISIIIRERGTVNGNTHNIQVEINCLFIQEQN